VFYCRNLDPSAAWPLHFGWLQPNPAGAPARRVKIRLTAAPVNAGGGGGAVAASAFRTSPRQRFTENL